MQSLRSIARLIVFLVGFSFLFGQLFNGYFSIAVSLLGGGAMFLGFATRESKLQNRESSRTVLLLGLICLVGAAYDIFAYYSEPPFSGNYYPWVLIGPFLASVLFLIFQFSGWMAGDRINQEQR